MTPGRAGLDAEASELPGDSGGKRLRSRMRLTLTDEHLWSRQRGDVGDMIGVSMSEEEVAQLQPEFVDLGHQRCGISTRVKSSGFEGPAVPDEVGIHRHVMKGGVALRQTGQGDRLWKPCALGHRYESGTVQAKYRR